jgi:hypothetical protein
VDLYKARWFALAYSMGLAKRMQLMDRMRNENLLHHS